MIKCVLFLGYTTSWVIDNVQLIKYDRLFATGSNAVQGGCRSACRITCSSPLAIRGGGLANDWRRLWVIHMCRGFDPLFWPSGYETRSFWGVFSHPPTQKRSFGYKSSQNSIFLAPKYHFPLDLFGSNLQWPTAHPQQFSDRVPPPGAKRVLLAVVQRVGRDKSHWCGCQSWILNHGFANIWLCIFFRTNDITKYVEIK